MKLEFGMYVRFDYHRVTVPIQISKIIRVHYDEVEKDYYYLTDTGLVIGEDNLVKEPSFNPENLIEEGDYVNGKKVYKENGKLFIENWWLENVKIKSIVTKEQFKDVSYKVGE